MLSYAEVMLWLKSQGAERILNQPDSLIAFRRSVSFHGKRRDYWCSITLTKIVGPEGDLYIRESDTWPLCDEPPKAAEEFKSE